MFVAALVAPRPLSFFHSSSCNYRLKLLDSTFLPTHPLPLRKSVHPAAARFFWRNQAFSSGAADIDAGRDVPHRLFDFDAFLSVAEVLCIAPSLFFAVGATAGCLLPRGTPKLFQICSGNVLFAGQIFTMVAAVLIGGLIRQRQLRRMCTDSNATGVDVVQRIAKLEEDIRSSTTIVRVLSRQLEKLGTRFRVTRRTLKDPISETAVLAQKNSEATRVLALQTEILEKELREIQMVLLAMQDQQQKQLDLILAIVKAGKLFKSKTKRPGQETAENTNPVSSEKGRLEQIDAQRGIRDGQGADNAIS